MRSEMDDWLAEQFPNGELCCDDQIPKNYYIIHDSDRFLFRYAVVQDCGPYARHICNFARYKKAVEFARKHYRNCYLAGNTVE